MVLILLMMAIKSSSQFADGHQDVVKVISKTHGKELKFGGVMPLLGY